MKIVYDEAKVLENLESLQKHNAETRRKNCRLQIIRWILIVIGIFVMTSIYYKLTVDAIEALKQDYAYYCVLVCVCYFVVYIAFCVIIIEGARGMISLTREVDITNLPAVKYSNLLKENVSILDIDITYEGLVAEFESLEHIVCTEILCQNDKYKKIWRTDIEEEFFDINECVYYVPYHIESEQEDKSEL